MSSVSRSESKGNNKIETMKVSELKKWLDDFNEDLEVVIGDYDKISDEDEYVFRDINGLEQLTSVDKKEFISIHY